MKEKTTYCLAELKKMGWTPKIIEQLLPEPILKKNPMYACASPMKLWNIADVEKAMKTPEFIEHLEKHTKRQTASKKAVNTKKQKALDELEEIKATIVIKQWPEDKLRQVTLSEKQRWYHEHDNYEDNAFKADEETQKRWMVNYIRHHLTTYDKNLCELYGKTGKGRLYLNLKCYILKKIAEQYPYLDVECFSQIDRSYADVLMREAYRNNRY